MSYNGEVQARIWGTEVQSTSQLIGKKFPKLSREALNISKWQPCLFWMHPKYPTESKYTTAFII